MPISGALVRRFMLASLIIVMCLTSGCAALVSRPSKLNTAGFGLPILCGPYIDATIIRESFSDGGALWILGVLDYPLSLVLDIVLLPADLISALITDQRGNACFRLFGAIGGREIQ